MAARCRRSLLRALPVVLLFVGAHAAQGQVSMQNALRRTNFWVGLEENWKHQVLFVQVDAVAAGGGLAVNYEFEGGHVYKIVAVGDDDRILDVNLAVKQVDPKTKKEDVFKEDTDDQNWAMVQFAVPARFPKIRLKVEVTAPRAREGCRDGYCGLVVIRLDH